MKVRVYKLGSDEFEEFECDTFEPYSNKSSGSAGSFVRLKKCTGRSVGTKKYKTVALIPNSYIIERVS